MNSETPFHKNPSEAKTYPIFQCLLATFLIWRWSWRCLSYGLPRHFFYNQIFLRVKRECQDSSSAQSSVRKWTACIYFFSLWLLLRMLPTWDHMGPREHPIRIKAKEQQIFTRQLGSLLRFNNLYLKKNVSKNSSGPHAKNKNNLTHGFLKLLN